MELVLLVWQSTPNVVWTPGVKAIGQPKPIWDSVSGVLETGILVSTSLLISPFSSPVACESSISLGVLIRP